MLISIDKITGEGLDLSALNTLFLAVPASFEGRVIQQLGRLTRGPADVSLSAVVHDYRDKDVPFLERRYARRRRIMATDAFQAAEQAVPSHP